MMWPRFLASRLVRSMGYEVRRVASPADLKIESAGTDPLTLDYCPSRRGYAVFDIKVADSRGFHSLGLRFEPGEHPFVRAYDRAGQGQAPDGERKAIRAVLEDYYASVRPSSAADVAGLPARDAPGLKGVSPMGYVLPWWEHDVGAMTRGRERSLQLVGMRYGVKTPPDAGHTFFGPVQKPKLDLQVERLHQLLESVRKDGFKPFARDFPTKVVALRKGTDYRWLVQEGQHRFALAGAIDVPTIPAMVTAIVRREDSALWPQVAGKVFTAKGAERLFDRLWDGDPAPICKAWVTAGR